MLRLRQSNWGNILFDLWVVGFSLLVLVLLLRQIDNGHQTRKLVRANHRLIIENRRLTKDALRLARRVADNAKNSDRRICTRINNVNALITQTLDRSLKNLPRVAYFKEHPQELRNQIASIKLEKARFKPRHCREEVK